MTSIAASSRRLVWVLAGLCAVVLITAVSVVLLRPGGAQLPAGSPQAATQSYLNAYSAADWEQVHRLSVQPGQRACNDGQGLQEVGIELVSASSTGSTATVRVRMNMLHLEGPLSLGMGGYEDEFQLTRQDGVWKVSLAPWLVALCTDEEMGY